MIKIIFESHGTTLDNEAKLSSGWFDAELSELGIKQSEELGERYKNNLPDAVFCLDSQRSSKTAEIAFGNVVPIIKDKRLKECNYGDFTRKPNKIVEKEKSERIDHPFPNGESYQNTTKRMKKFLIDISKKYDGKTIMIIGHRATQYGLENLINKIPLEKIVTALWHWQAGWIYELEDIK